MLSTSSETSPRTSALRRSVPRSEHGTWLVGHSSFHSQDSSARSSPAAAVILSERRARRRGHDVPRPPNLEQYLLQDDEVPGLEPMASPQTDSGPPFDLPEDGAERLGAVAMSRRPTSPPKASASAASAASCCSRPRPGARDWMAYETSDEAIRHQMPGAKIERFQVSDVPGAHGWTGPDLHGNAIGQVYWTQGRCMMPSPSRSRGRVSNLCRPPPSQSTSARVAPAQIESLSAGDQPTRRCGRGSIVPVRATSAWGRRSWWDRCWRPSSTSPGGDRVWCRVPD